MDKEPFITFGHLTDDRISNVTIDQKQATIIDTPNGERLWYGLSESEEKKVRFIDQNGSGKAIPSRNAFYTRAYDGRKLNIAIIGENLERTYNQVTFTNVEADELNNAKTAYDAFYITDQYFNELSQKKWKKTFRNIKTPVFFLNMDEHTFIYYTGELTYDKHSFPSNSNSEGFVNVKVKGEKNVHYWGYGDPSDSTNPNEVPQDIMNFMLRDIEKFTYKEN
ncbi:hypothetical protein JFL43_09855 [Viridibacillus sp. YIM B01967]|uniref:Uncharacterized protein n=1 Tax=Viridibacillus soli TaxID=2798301 RepID=A0ABS1H804_9BACL|nr:hypothetical protein [Viridibacillus soli]MBK3495153.1 hypothetical protein [Viridibacillus soli]